MHISLIRKIGRLYICLFFLCWHAANAQDTASYQRITDSFSKSDNKKGLLAFFEKELKNYPNSYEVQFQMGKACYINDDLKKAEIFFNKAIAINKDCDKCYSGLFFINLDLKKSNEASKAINEAIRLQPLNSIYYIHRAALNVQMNRQWDAEADITKAISIAPNDATNYYTRAHLHRSNDRLLSAMSDYEKAIAISPNYDQAIEELATLYGSIKEWDKLHQLIDNSLKVQPQQKNFYIIRAGIYAENKIFDKASADIESALTMDLDFYYAYYAKGMLAYMQEDMNAACTHYQKALALIQSQKGDNDLKSTIQKSMENFCNTELASYYYQRGVAYYNLNKMEQAINVYDDGLKKFPNNPMMHSFKANALSILGQYDAAIFHNKTALAHFKNYKKEVDLSANFEGQSEAEINNYLQVAKVDIYKEIAKSYAAKQEPSMALKYIDSAIALYPNIHSNNNSAIVPKTYFIFEKGKILLENSQYREAIQVFDEILKDEPMIAEVSIFKAIAIVSNELGKPDRVQSRKIGIRHSNVELFSWNTTKNVAATKDTKVYRDAIKICDYVIENNPQYAFAYFIRGQIKYIINESDYCYDIAKAKQIDETMIADINSLCP